MDWPGSAQSTRGGALGVCTPQQAVLPAPALPASALVPGQSRGTEELHKWLSLLGLNLLLLSFMPKTPGHSQTCTLSPVTLALLLPPACCWCWAGKAAAQHPQLLLSSLPTKRLVPPGCSSPLLSQRVAS